MLQLLVLLLFIADAMPLRGDDGKGILVLDAELDDDIDDKGGRPS
jgi:hypothetical protein